MRLTIILLIAFVLNAGAKGTAQTVTLSVKDMPLEKVCKEIERQTGYYFVYAKDLTSESHLVSVKVVNASIGETLRQLFYGLPFSWQVINRVVVVNTVRADRHVMTSIIDRLGGTLIKVEGIVQNEAGQPISEASVTIKKTGKGTLTNENGRFLFPSLEAGTELIISHIGYLDQIVLANDNFQTIKLPVAIRGLDATVVKGYYNTSGRLNTGNVATVKGEDIARQPVSDPLLALEGRVPGLYISQASGAPGAYSTIRLRGQNSIPRNKPTTANDPLYIVDGVPFNSQTLTSSDLGGGILSGSNPDGLRQGLSPFNYINPSDIESIEVLKDADATAIYGSRGANGVIVITTKKGKVGQTKIDISAYTGASSITRKFDLLNTQQYLQIRRELHRNDNSQLFPGEYDINGFWDTTRYTNWQKILMGAPAAFTNMQAGVSGGNLNSQYSIGVGYNKQGVSFPGPYADQKISTHISLGSSSPNNKLSVQFSAMYTNDNSNLPTTTDVLKNIFLAPDAPTLYDVNGNLNWQTDDGSATFSNPLAVTTQNSKAVSKFLSGNLLLSYQIIPGLYVINNMGYSTGQMDQLLTSPSISYPPPNDNPYFRSSGFSTSSTNTWNVEPQIKYLFRVGKGRLEMLAGTTFLENVNKSTAMYATGFSSDALISNPLAATDKEFSSYTYTLYHYNALFGRVGFSWEDTYLLNITARRDGSSRFGPGKQFGNFGAIAAGWIFSNEKFIHHLLPGISFGKIRASYGITGNDNITDYQYLSSYSPGSTTYQGVVVMTPDRMPNPYYAWEQVRKFEAGIELGFIKDRIWISGSYYRNRTNNQLVGYPLPSLTGFTSVQANLPALIQNTGVEFVVNTTNIKSKSITWTSSFNVSIPENLLVRYPGLGSSAYAQTYAVGHSLFSKYVYHYTGVSPQTGLYTFATKSGNNTLTFQDRQMSRPVSQVYFGGLQNTFVFKGLRLDIMMQFVKQYGSSYLGNLSSSVGGFNQNVPVSLIKNRWQKPGDNATSQLLSQNSSAVQRYSYFLLSDGNIVDASFIRIKSIALSYQLSPRWRKAVRLEDASIFLQCQNLFTITSYPGMDPETGGGLNLPPMRTITGGFRILF